MALLADERRKNVKNSKKTRASFSYSNSSSGHLFDVPFLFFYPETFY
jgi:hypothetical protein